MRNWGDNPFAVGLAAAIITGLIIVPTYLLLISRQEASVKDGLVSKYGDAVTNAYIVTVYADSGAVLRRWAGIDKVSIRDSGAIHFFDDDGNSVILSPGCDVVVEWIGEPDE